MSKDKISNIQFACLIVFPVLAFFLGIGTHNTIKIAEVDSYISVFLAYLIGFIPLLLFMLIFNYKKELDLKDKVKYLFGSTLGTIINWLIYILIFIIGATLFISISNFAISQFLAETPVLALMLLLSLVLIYNVSLGIENISRVSIIFLAIICLLTIVSTAGVIPHFEMSNIKPILENGIISPLKGGLVLTLTNVVPIFVLLVVPKDKIQDNQKTNKYLVAFYTLAFVFAFLAMLLTIGSLGIYLCNVYQYPEYTVLKKISLFNSIDRVENFVYIKWILSSVSCLSLIIYYLNASIKKDSKKLFPTIVIALMIFFTLKIFINNTIFYKFILNIFPYICLFLLCIYVIIGINIIVRKIMDLDKLASKEQNNSVSTT